MDFNVQLKRNRLISVLELKDAYQYNQEDRRENMILLVSPRIDGMKTPQAALGIGYIASYLENNGIACDVMNLSYEAITVDEFIHHTISRGYRVVGFTLKDTSQMDFVCSVALKLKEKGIIIIAGGYLPTLSYKFLLKNYPFIDYVIRGEAEQSMLYFAKHLDSDNRYNCPGLSYIKDAEIIGNEIPRPIDDLSNLPYPKRPYINVLLKNRLSINMVSSRGCVNNCSFCAVSAFYRVCTGRNYWRALPPAALYEEMMHYHRNYGVIHFNFVDNNFFGNF